ncbi:MAG: hypothetical protein JO038_08835 [Alphaproteobacteria bacterium]|nr:hypothetical protein [Alphaproteobacteria bacterium]
MQTPRFMLLALALLALAGCDPALGRAEFAPPQDRWPSTLPSAIARETPAPAVPLQYCYHTLAQADCYLTPQPGRLGFTGTYPIPGQY